MDSDYLLPTPILLAGVETITPRRSAYEILRRILSARTDAYTPV